MFLQSSSLLKHQELPEAELDTGSTLPTPESTKTLRTRKMSLGSYREKPTNERQIECVRLQFQKKNGFERISQNVRTSH